MPQLIKGRAIVEDGWSLVRRASSMVEVPPQGRAIVPLALWLSQREALLHGDGNPNYSFYQAELNRCRDLIHGCHGQLGDS